MAKKGGLGKGLDAIFYDNAREDDAGAVELSINDLEPNRTQPRQSFDDGAMTELADSIAQHGVLQPILVRPLLSGGYQIVAGERRWRASRMAGLTTVPAVIRDLTDSEVMQLALIENLQREDLKPLEEANGYKMLMDNFEFTQEEIAKTVGKSRPAITNAAFESAGGYAEHVGARRNDCGPCQNAAELQKRRPDESGGKTRDYGGYLRARAGKNGKARKRGKAGKGR